MRRTNYVTCTCGKRAYRTEEEAERVLDQCRRNRKGRIAQQKRKENRIYECEWTGWFHLTSQEARWAS